MALIEQRLAEQLIEARAEQALGGLYVEIQRHIDALQHHLDREMELRAKVAEVLES